ncbi:hypothetical protein T4E_10166 [Trichinella pseudospiralis]|uniref:Uncharacterized protein n=1 Tax=Trichinella pseudospiralis TaxID=6337 RepID=A0A0V0YDJ1_TRIPS|nr:hypothetical protein T4E_10166 [Trichinella pseudospiralis]
MVLTKLRSIKQKLQPWCTVDAISHSLYILIIIVNFNNQIKGLFFKRDKILVFICKMHCR